MLHGNDALVKMEKKLMVQAWDERMTGSARANQQVTMFRGSRAVLIASLMLATLPW